MEATQGVHTVWTDVLGWKSLHGHRPVTCFQEAEALWPPLVCWGLCVPVLLDRNPFLHTHTHKPKIPQTLKQNTHIYTHTITTKPNPNTHTHTHWHGIRSIDSLCLGPVLRLLVTVTNAWLKLCGNGLIQLMITPWENVVGQNSSCYSSREVQREKGHTARDLHFSLTLCRSVACGIELPAFRTGLLRLGGLGLETLFLTRL